MSESKERSLQQLNIDLSKNSALMDELKKNPEKFLSQYGLVPEDLPVDEVSGGSCYTSRQ